MGWGIKPPSHFLIKRVSKLNIKLYKCSDDPKKLYKTYGSESVRNGTPYKPVDDLSGYVILEYTADIETYNAASLEWGGKTKYYTITSIQADIGNKVIVNLYEDVLKTFETEIGDLYVVVARTSNKSVYNSYLPDQKLVMQSNLLCQNYAFGEGAFTYDHSIILGVIGSQPTEIVNNGKTTANLVTYGQ